MEKINYSFDEITLMANKNINLINNIVKLEKLGVIKTEINGQRNDDAFKIIELDNFFIAESKKELDLSEDDELTKEHVNQILTNMKFKDLNKFYFKKTLMSMGGNL